MKKFVFTLAGALALLISSGTAIADRWNFMGENKKEVFLINVSDIKKSNAYTMAWVATINIDPKLPYDLNLLRFKLDCADDTQQVQVSYKYLKGKQIESFTSGTDWFVSPPGSLGHLVIKAVCNPKNDSPYSIETESIIDYAPRIQDIMRSVAKRSAAKQ